MKNTSQSTLTIRRAPIGRNAGIINFYNWHPRVILGSGSIHAFKQEGDGTTPSGQYKILFGFWRSDRLKRPSTKLDLMPTRKEYGWCDEPTHPRYNQHIDIAKDKNLPSHECLWRHDNLYDICLVISHNLHPRIKNRGSAVFIHLQHPDKTPTQGCVALELPDMFRLLRTVVPGTKIHIHP